MQISAYVCAREGGERRKYAPTHLLLRKREMRFFMLTANHARHHAQSKVGREALITPGENNSSDKPGK
jgi:hypothetical protein